MSNQVRGIFILRVYLQGTFLELGLLRQMVKTRGVPGWLIGLGMQLLIFGSVPDLRFLPQGRLHPAPAGSPPLFLSL